MIDWLAREPADLLLLQELTPAWAVALDAVHGLPHRRLLIRSDPYGLGVLSRWPIDDLEARDLAGDGIPSLVGDVEADGAPFRFAALHTHWPPLPDLMRRRDLVLETLADEVRRQPGRWVVAGDFNATPYSPVFQRLLDKSGLRDTRPSGAWAPSWRAGFWPLALRIDHVLVVARRVRGPERSRPGDRLRSPARSGARALARGRLNQLAGSISPVGGAKVRQHSPSHDRKRTTLGSAKASGGAARNQALR